MLSLDFAGWLQCRLATDPDEYGEPRGQSGWTFAMPGEPDLDRLIRFHNPVAPRSHTPQVGVTVHEVRINQATVPGHVLLNSPVQLLDGPVFEGRNGEIATSANEPIVPFHIRFEAPGIVLVGRDPIDLSDPNDLSRRQPVAFESNSLEVAQHTGITDRVAYRRQRKSLLESELATETDATRIAALQKRIDELGKSSIRLSSLGFKLTYQFALRGPNEWSDPEQMLGQAPTASTVWSIDFWMGAWDADALCAYVSGSLNVG
jgi:hypothetical protein